MSWAWSRYSLNGYELSSRGDKRFSAFYARLPNGRTVEDVYQTDIKGYPDCKSGKGNPTLNGQAKDELWQAYLGLWREWASHNKAAVEDLRVKAAGRILTDMFATSDVNQAHAFAEILNESQSGDDDWDPVER